MSEKEKNLSRLREKKMLFEKLQRDPGFMEYKGILETRIEDVEGAILGMQVSEISKEDSLLKMRDLISQRNAFKFCLGIVDLIAATKIDGGNTNRLEELDPYISLDEVRKLFGSV